MPHGGVLVIWILVVVAIALDIAALIWGNLLSVVLLSVGVLVAGGALRFGGRQP
jgi:hypothetical protein